MVKTAMDEEWVRVAIMYIFIIGLLMENQVVKEKSFILSGNKSQQAPTVDIISVTFLRYPSMVVHREIVLKTRTLSGNI